MANNTEQLLKQAQGFPNNPGCYMFIDAEDEIVYIGKAKNLRKRVIQYFNKVHNYRLTNLLNVACKIKFIITTTEMEALILENNLIKKYYPKYNILLKDDKAYPYIVLTKEEYPKLSYVRRINNKSKYLRAYGPFPTGFYALEILTLLNRIFKFRKCKDIPKKECLYYHIDQCIAPCINKITFNDYSDMIKNLDNFFKGKVSDIKKQIMLDIEKSSSTLNFEQADTQKKLLNTINTFVAKQKIEFQDRIDRDFVGYYLKDDMIAISVFFYRGGKLLSFISEMCKLFVDIPTSIKLFLQNIYQNNTKPDIIVLDNSAHYDELIDANTKIIIPKSGKNRDILNLVHENAKTVFNQNYTKAVLKEKNDTELLNKCKEIFKLKKSNIKFELVDTSHIQGSNYVGAVVHFNNLNKIYHNYRKYNLNEITSSNDPLAIYLTLDKHFNQSVNLPDVLLVDGAQAQLNAAAAVLKQHSIESKVALAGLVKDESHKTHHLLLASGEVINLKDNPEMLKFLGRMQDEVHNFAISLFRKKHTKNLFISELDQIPGVGPKTKIILTKEFSDIVAIKNASQEDLIKVVNKTTALNIYNYFHSK